MAHWKSGDRGTKLALPFRIKADQEQRTVEGYASVFNVLDSDGDVVVPGAFQESITKRFHEEKLIKMLWQHDTAEPMGLPVELREDSKGLYFKAKVSDTPTNTERLKLMADKVVDRVSIGFGVEKAEEFEDEEARQQLSGIARVLPLMRLIKLKLYEFSPVTFAANERAVILAVKNQYGWVPTFDNPELWLGDRLTAEPEDTKQDDQEEGAEPAGEDGMCADSLDNQQPDQDIADCDCPEDKGSEQQHDWQPLAELAAEMKRQRQLDALADCATLLTNMTSAQDGA